MIGNLYLNIRRRYWEWMLNMKNNDTHKNLRRRLLHLIGLVPLSAMTTAKADSNKTPTTAEGPYYPSEAMRYSDDDNDLVKITEQTVQAGGQIINLDGIVTDVEHSPLAGIRVEIWQCDVNGRYIHTEDRNTTSPDSGFQGFGHTVTDENGEYRFRTIMPVSYPGRAPHIHVKLFRDAEVVTTQFYIKDHPENAGDVLYRRMTKDEQQSVVMEFSSAENVLETTVNLVF